jgi:peptidoglycan/xylan/chitin deacetylase (PgdA/CDA1 family)
MGQVLVASMWDDGLTANIKLVEELDRIGVITSFAISPGLHKNHRTLNDYRDPKYGELVSIQELNVFGHHEIINHSATHIDFTNADSDMTINEIRIGKSMLEDLFQKEIVGFCYPYGCHNQHCHEALKQTNHLFARTTKGWPLSIPRHHCLNKYQLHPTCKWNHPNLLKLIDAAHMICGHVLFWGHTYELVSECDWKQIIDLYLSVKNHPYARLTSVKDIARKQYKLYA